MKIINLQNNDSLIHAYILDVLKDFKSKYSFLKILCKEFKLRCWFYVNLESEGENTLKLKDINKNEIIWTNRSTWATDSVISAIRYICKLKNLDIDYLKLITQ